MGIQAKYDYEEVIQEYEQISSEKGHLLQSEEVDNCSALPSIAWFIKKGGLKKVRSDLGFNASNSDFCNDCTENPCSCNYKPDNCPLMKDADLYFSNVDYTPYTQNNHASHKRKRKTVKLSNEQMDEIIKLKSEGIYWEKLGERYGINKNTLYKKVKRYMGDDWENRGWK